MSNDPDLPQAPSYADTQTQALYSFLNTNPQYREVAVKQALGTYAPQSSNGAQQKQFGDLQAAYARAQAEELAAKAASNGITSDPAYLAAMNKTSQAFNALDTFKRTNNLTETKDLGDLDVAMGYGKAALDLGDDQARRQLALRQELGVKTVQQANAELQASDPIAYAGNQALKQQLYDNAQKSQSDLGMLPDMVTGAGVAYQLGPDGNYITLRDRAASNLAGLSTGTLAKLRDDAQAEYNLGSKLDDTTRQEIEQAARAGQAARGNILGNAAAYSEASEIGSAGEARKQQRTANLSALQGQYDAQDSANMAALGQYTGAVNADKDRLTNNVYTAEGNLAGRRQQNQANMQSILLGTPLSAQYGTLGAAGQGSVSYNPFIGNQSATAANGNAGSQFALGVYNQQSQNALGAANTSNPWLNMATGVIGNFAGAYTGGVGAGLAANTFSSGSAGQQAAINNGKRT